MAVELATAYVSIIPSTKGIAGQLRSELVGPLEAAGEEGGRRFSGGLTAIGGKAAKVGGVAVAAGFAAALTKGFGRLRAIDDAQFKLAGLGHDAATVDAIMESALESVMGTAFGLDEAATIAASAVAAGVKPGEDLTRTLSLTGDAASIAGVSLGEMGAIFGKVGAGNRMMTQEMNQLTDRGIPVLQWLQDEFGVTAEAAREMVSNGEVDFATFQKIIEDNIGGAALKAGESFSGSFANMGAALGRFGAALLGPAFAAAPAVFGRITGALNTVTGAVTPLVERFSGPLARGMGVVAGLITAVLVPAMIAWGVQSTIAAAKTVTAWTVAQLASIKSAAVQAVAVARTVAGWVLMGVQSLLGAAKMAAAWFIALGPIGWVIAAVVAVAALIVANWDTIKKWTVKAWKAVSGAVVAAWKAVTGAVGRAWDWIVGKFRQATGWLTRTWDSMWGSVRRVADSAVTFVRGIPGRILSALGGFASSVASFIARWHPAAVLYRMIQAGLPRVVSFVRGIPQRILSALGSLGSLLSGAGRDLVQGFRDSIRQKWDDMVGWLGRQADRLPGVVKKVLGMASPSKVFAALGVQTGEGMLVGMQSMMRAVSDQAAKLAGAAVPEFGSTPSPSLASMRPAAAIRADAVEPPPDANGWAGAAFGDIHVGDRRDADELIARLRMAVAVSG